MGGKIDRRSQRSREGPTRPLRHDLAVHNVREVIDYKVAAGEAPQAWPRHRPIAWGEPQQTPRPVAALVASHGVHAAIGEIQQKVSAYAITHLDLIVPRQDGQVEEPPDTLWERPPPSAHSPGPCGGVRHGDVHRDREHQTVKVRGGEGESERAQLTREVCQHWRSNAFPSDCAPGFPLSVIRSIKPPKRAQCEASGAARESVCHCSPSAPVVQERNSKATPYARHRRS